MSKVKWYYKKWNKWNDNGRPNNVSSIITYTNKYYLITDYL